MRQTFCCMHLSIRDKSNFSRHQEHLLSLSNLQAVLHRTGKQVNVCKVCWSGKSNRKCLMESETVERSFAFQTKDSPRNERYLKTSTSASGTES